jgi:hypothetical protein
MNICGGVGTCSLVSAVAPVAAENYASLPAGGKLAIPGQRAQGAGIAGLPWTRRGSGCGSDPDQDVRSCRSGADIA